MSYLPVILFSIFLVGCSTTKIVYIYPEPPAALMQPVEQLEPLPTENVDMKTVARIIGENYLKYHVLAEKYKDWQEWANSQKNPQN